MSANTASITEEVLRAHRRPRRPLNWAATRFGLCLSIAACLAVVLPAASMSAANAAPVAAARPHGGGPGYGQGSGIGRGLGRGLSWSHYRHGRHFLISGTVANLGESTFELVVTLPGVGKWGCVLTSTTATIDVTTTGNTVYIEPGQSSPSISGLQNGDSVNVTGMPTGPGALTALLVKVPLVTDKGVVASPSGTGFGLTVAGPSKPRGCGWVPPPTLTSTSSTLTSTSTTVQVTVNGTTQYREPGQGSPGIGNIMAGDNVQVTGVQAGTSGLTALVVTVPLVKVVGSASNVATKSFDVAAHHGASTLVDTSTSTKYFEPGVSSPTVQNGDYVTVTGTQGGTSTVNALLVLIRPSNPTPWSGPGGGPGSGGGRHHGRH
jgi:hypothetical protein